MNQAQNNPIRAQRMRTRRTLVGCCAWLLPASVWAAWPHRPGVFQSPPVGVRTQVTRNEPRPAVLNAGAFDAQLWVFEIAPPLPMAKAPPPPPLRLQLVGIIGDQDEAGRKCFRAALYDPDVDELLIVSEGQHVGARRVAAVSALAIQLSSSDEQVQTLALQSGRSEGSR